MSDERIILSLLQDTVDYHLQDDSCERISFLERLNLTMKTIHIIHSENVKDEYSEDFCNIMQKLSNRITEISEYLCKEKKLNDHLTEISEEKETDKSEIKQDIHFDDQIYVEKLFSVPENVIPYNTPWV